MYVHGGLRRRHVFESNKIEGILAHPGDALFDGHWAATRMVANGKIIHPNKLHQTIVRRVPGLQACGGQYRTFPIYVGPKEMPRKECVPILMKDWWSLVKEYENSTSDFLDSSYFLHTWFLCIHPYVDANGRTSRLVWNMLRVSKGLSWYVQSSKTKHAYYMRIRMIEEKIFKTEYPDVY